MRVLVLGGTHHVGRAVVEAAVRRINTLRLTFGNPDKSPVRSEAPARCGNTGRAYPPRSELDER
jgi:uncharacterized protein YbjT (DUF2867 family)